MMFRFHVLVWIFVIGCCLWFCSLLLICFETEWSNCVSFTFTSYFNYQNKLL
jgi:hypothetical protein